ncbi:hypothetical protein [Streptomyces venezuelae]|uniref:hypothetical protein n=1 Tax=Streptomyces venezuelae TaxID=54571 RepID=UPI001CC24F19|nr:hypothetical protein [Streptomyces venezuelae]
MTPCRILRLEVPDAVRLGVLDAGFFHGGCTVDELLACRSMPAAVRATLAARNGIADTPGVEPSGIIRRALAERCARTFSRYGMEELHGLLHIDATLRLPPYAKCGFRGTALGAHKYLCSRPENLTTVAERVFVSDAQGEMFDAHGMRRRATVDLSCSFGTQKFRAPPAGHVPCGSALYFR